MSGGRTDRPGSARPRDPTSKLDDTVARARRERDARMRGYRERALRLLPWICGRCSREFTHANVHELTVHHRDHDHDNNPADGSNWELLCIYCHEDEHARHVDGARGNAAPREPGGPAATHRPFEALAGLLRREDD